VSLANVRAMPYFSRYFTNSSSKIDGIVMDVDLQKRTRVNLVEHCRALAAKSAPPQRAAVGSAQLELVCPSFVGAGLDRRQHHRQ
jgi:hypothetical protein